MLFELRKNLPHFILTGKLWGIFSEFFGEKTLHNKSSRVHCIVFYEWEANNQKTVQNLEAKSPTEKKNHSSAMCNRVHVHSRANNCTEYKSSSQYMKYYGLSAANERQTGRHTGYTDRQMVLRATMTFQPKPRVKNVHLSIMDPDAVTTLLLLSMY